MLPAESCLEWRSTLHCLCLLMFSFENTYCVCPVPTVASLVPAISVQFSPPLPPTPPAPHQNTWEPFASNQRSSTWGWAPGKRQVYGEPVLRQIHLPHRRGSVELTHRGRQSREKRENRHREERQRRERVVDFYFAQILQMDALLETPGVSEPPETVT